MLLLQTGTTALGVVTLQDHWINLEVGAGVNRCGLLSEDIMLHLGCVCFAMALFAMAKLGPPDQKRYTLCIYKDESSCNKGGNPEVEVELLEALGSRETSEVPIYIYICMFKLFAFFATFT